MATTNGRRGPVVELHLVQNFAPSNLNRDDTGAPKDCDFGGYRRARISSQCLKRAIRSSDKFAEVLEANGAVRTRRLILEVADRLAGIGTPPDRTVQIVAEVFAAGGIERPKVRAGEEAEKDNTKLILFMERRALDQIAGHFRDHWAGLETQKNQSRDALISQIGATLENAVRAPDIALFGRMVEVGDNTPFGKRQLSVVAASQVAHAISTHAVNTEFDFFTAVDDLNPAGSTGAGMMGTVEFNSACFYRYANVDAGQLLENLGGDGDAMNVMARTVEAFVRASVVAVPTGKQNSMAAQNPPSLVLAVVRDGGFWSLANAFVRPVRPDGDGDLVAQSIRALDRYWGELVAMYGDDGIAGAWACTLGGNGLSRLTEQKAEKVDSVNDVATKVREAVAGWQRS
jgi:CRISPR system Cascade subunit CasC